MGYTYGPPRQGNVANLSFTQGQENMFNRAGPLGGDSGFGMNLGTFNTGLSAISTGFNLWNTHEQNKIAKDTLAFNKDVFNKKFDLYKKDRSRKIRRENSIASQLDSAYGSQWKDTFKRDNPTPDA